MALRLEFNNDGGQERRYPRSLGRVLERWLGVTAIDEILPPLPRRADITNVLEQTPDLVTTTSVATGNVRSTAEVASWPRAVEVFRPIEDF